MALGQVSHLVSNNLDKYPVVYQRQVGGNRSVETVTDLSNIPLGILIDPDQDIKFSLGQLWYVISKDSFYKLKSITNNKPVWVEYIVNSSGGGGTSSIVWGEGDAFAEANTVK